MSLHGNFPWSGQCLVDGLGGQGGLRRVPVGGKGRRKRGLDLGLAVAARGQPGFLGALDLRDAAVVDDELNDAEAKALDLFTHEGDPVGSLIGHGVGRGGRR